MKVLVKLDRPVYVSPIALVTSVDENNRPNIMAVGEVFNLSSNKPVIVGVGIRSATYTHELISATHEFVLNLAPTSIIEKVDGCGWISGRDEPDKFSRFGLTAIPASKVRPPLIDECPINIECTLVEIKSPGDHDLIIGEVVAVHADKDVVSGNGKVRPEKLDLLMFNAGEYWSMGQKLKDFWFSRPRS